MGLYLLRLQADVLFLNSNVLYNNAWGQNRKDPIFISKPHISAQILIFNVNGTNQKKDTGYTKKVQKRDRIPVQVIIFATCCLSQNIGNFDYSSFIYKNY